MKGLRIMKYKQLILIIIIMVVFVSACQQDPEKQAVANKGGDEFEERLMRKSSSENDVSYFSFKEFKDNFELKDGLTSIAIDAKVEIPNVQRYPVVLVKPVPVTDADVKRIANVLMPGARYYKMPEAMTKEQIENAIVYKELFIKNMNDSLKDNKITQALIQQALDAIKTEEEEIMQLKKEYEKAPESIKLDMASLILKDIENEYGEIKRSDYIYAILENADIACFVASVNDNGGSNVSFNREIPIYSLYDNMTTNTKDIPEKDIDLSFEEAVVIAKQTIENMKLDLHLSAAITDLKGISNYTSGYPSYIFHFSKMIHDVPTTYEESRGTDLIDMDDYRDTVEYEDMQIVINDNGIVHFEYRSKHDVIEVINNDVWLMTFEDMYEKAKDAFEYNYDKVNFLQDDVLIQSPKEVITIDRITLGLMRINKKDDYDTYWLIPVWDFFGSIYYPETEETGNNGYNSFLTINAIDGSVIDRGFGY